MKLSTLLATAAIALFTACNSNETTSKETSKTKEANFDVMAESFGDLQILRYQVPGFEKLTAKEKELCYYLYEATMCGRDMIYDQKSKYGILLRKTI